MVAPFTFAGAVFLAHSARIGEARRRGNSLRPTKTRTPNQLEMLVNDAIDQSDLRLSGQQLISGWGIAALLALFTAPLLGVATAATISAGVVLALPAWAIKTRRSAAHARRRGVPALTDSIISGVRGGESLAGVIDTAVAPGPLGRDLDRLRLMRVSGMSAVESLRTWWSASNDPDVRALVAGLAIALDLGGPATDGLEGLSAALRARDAVRSEALSLATQSRLSALVVAAAPLLFLVIGGAANPGSLAQLVSSWAGRASLLGGLALDALGAFWMSRIVNSVA
ncbi:MAG: type II secretion system F family protein [Actinomycetes bacterium]